MKLLLTVIAIIEAPAGIALLIMPAAALSICSAYRSTRPPVWSRGGSPERPLLPWPSHVGKQETANAKARRLESSRPCRFYNFAGAIVLVYAGIRLDLRNALLRPAIILHLGLGLWCVLQLWFTRRRISRSEMT